MSEDTYAKRVERWANEKSSQDMRDLHQRVEAEKQAARIYEARRVLVPASSKSLYEEMLETRNEILQEENEKLKGWNFCLMVAIVLGCILSLLSEYWT